MPPLYLDRWLVEQLMFGTGKARRFTQDSPVLPDVWIEFATDPDRREEKMTERGVRDETGHPPLNLLLTPYRTVPAGRVRKQVYDRVVSERKDPASKQYHANPLPARVIYNQSTVLATLYFEDLVRAVLPLTSWWKRHFGLAKDGKPNFDVSNLALAADAVATSIMDPENAPKVETHHGPRRIPPDVLWLIRIVGAIAVVQRGDELPEAFTRKELGVQKATHDDWKTIVLGVADLLKGIDPPQENDLCIHSVALNRVAGSTLFESRNAIKADAAAHLFSVSCKDIRWAVVDSGIDARHRAFRAPDDPKDEPDSGTPFDGYRSRIRETYDFTQLQLVLEGDSPELAAYLKKVADGDAKKLEMLEEQLSKVKDWLKDGRPIDWSVIAALLRIPHDESYRAPTDDHGTHVAGIIGANWTHNPDGSEREARLVGICPDIELIDLRILDQQRVGDEFTVMGALQFVRWLNATNDYMAVHGVNMSLSIPHDVANYACGRTPVCEEAERVVSSGVVVVAAAGNRGYRSFTIDNVPQQTYNTISITDPGNADLVITVGATHRARPHTYGVSYFSSRGPTGDGRLKPDLVAPGEKITAPLPDNGSGVKDGTSQAAPHVSGAAAMLMARHNELVGRPQRIKQVLCSTATDLGRERYFQGAGMLDILRAMQSI